MGNTSSENGMEEYKKSCMEKNGYISLETIFYTTKVMEHSARLLTNSLSNYWGDLQKTKNIEQTDPKLRKEVMNLIIMYLLMRKKVSEFKKFHTDFSEINNLEDLNNEELEELKNKLGAKIGEISGKKSKE